MMPDILEKPVVFRHLLISLSSGTEQICSSHSIFFFFFFYVSPEPPGKRVGLLNQSGDETLRLLECHSLLGLSELLSQLDNPFSEATLVSCLGFFEVLLDDLLGLGWKAKGISKIFPRSVPSFPCKTPSLALLIPPMPSRAKDGLRE